MMEPADKFSSTHLVQIEKPVYGGSSMARLDGKAVFVPLALPGEKVLIRIAQNKSGYAIAVAEEIVTPAPERIVPACPHFAVCGGCHYQHTDQATQIGFKQAILRETLTRAGVAVPDEIAILSGLSLGYRNRIRLAFDASGNPGYRTRQSHEVIPVRNCPIAAPLLLQAAQEAAKLLQQASPSVRAKEITLFCNAEESSLLVRITAANSKNFRLDEFSLALSKSIPSLAGTNLLLEGRDGSQRMIAQWGAKSIAYHAAGFDYRVDSGAFFQVNRWLVDALVEQVSGQHSGTLAWDLFSGVGLFARRLTANFKRVVAVESAPASTQALTANLKGTRGIPIRATTAEFLFREHKGECPDLIVVDPPRSGLGTESCKLLAAAASPALAYLSCDPATLARDLRVLLDAGYLIESMTLADLFPQTFHIETLVQLRQA